MIASSTVERIRPTLERLAHAVAWFLGAVLIALGSAGVVSGLDHQPGTAERPELTWAADRAVRRTLAAATDELAAISRQVDAIGVQGRGALAALAARQFETLETAVSEGGLLVGEVRDRSARLRGRLEAMDEFGLGAEMRLSAANRERHARLLAALRSTDGLPGAWARLASGGLSGARLSALLARHDELIASAIEAGRGGAFQAAIEDIDAAAAALDDADRLRAQLANTSDVGTLEEWLRRNRDYDTALRNLYEASAASPAFKTADVRRAIRAEREAREQLPGNTNGLVIIMADIAQGGLNQAIIGVEQARGELSAALAELRASESGPGPAAPSSPPAASVPPSSRPAASAAP